MSKKANFLERIHVAVRQLSRYLKIYDRSEKDNLYIDQVKVEVTKILRMIHNEKARMGGAKLVSMMGRYNAKAPSPGSKRTFNLKKHAMTGGKSKTGGGAGRRR